MFYQALLPIVYLQEQAQAVEKAESLLFDWVKDQPTNPLPYKYIFFVLFFIFIFFCKRVLLLFWSRHHARESNLTTTRKRKVTERLFWKLDPAWYVANIVLNF